MNKTNMRNQLLDWVQQGLIPQEKADAAAALTELRPNNKDWQSFIDRALLWLGSLALVFSLMFFIAYNWQDMGRFFKFALIECFMILAIGVYYKAPENSTTSKVSMLIATISLGVLLAFYGQTYQTGADSWELLFNWALLMLPWVLICRMPMMWIFWITLINVAIWLYYQVWGNAFFLFNKSFFNIFNSQSGTFFIFNLMILMIWQIFELYMNKRGVCLSMTHRVAIRLLGTVSGICITLLMSYVLNRIEEGSLFTWFVWVGWLATIYHVYRKIKVDVFMLAGGCLSILLVFIAFIMEHLRKDAEQFSLFIAIALVIITLATIFAKWLKNIHEESL